MKILIDCRFAALHAGLGCYTRELVSELLRIDSSIFTLLVKDRTESWIPPGSSLLEAPIPHYSIHEQLVLPRIIKQSNVDLLFSPHFNVPYFCTIPYVLTVHDLILHRYPNQASFFKRVAYRVLMNKAVHDAQSIISVSAFTASEIAFAYGTNVAFKTHIIGEGVNDAYKIYSSNEVSLFKQKHCLPDDFFVYVGNAKEHKNVGMLIDAFIKADTDSSLVLCTGGKEIERFGSLPSSVRILSGLSDEELPLLYNAARSFVTASLYEGYCLPAAEALACGCPVIACNRTAIPEIVAGNGLLIEPTVEAFRKAFNHPPILDAPVRVEEWKENAEKVFAVLTGKYGA